MENYKKVTTKKLTLMTAFTAFAAAFIALTGAFVYMGAGINEDVSAMIPGFQLGSFIGFQITMLMYIAKYRKALKTEDELKKLYIEEHDERTTLIKDKICSVGFLFSLVTITTATIITGFFNQIIFFTLFGVLLFMLLVIVFLVVYYRNKF